MKALLLAARPPWPPRRGDQLRARDFAEGLRRAGAEVEILCVGDGDGNAVLDSEASSETFRTESFPSSGLDRLVGGCAWLTGTPLQSALFRSRRLVQAALERVAQLGGDDVVLIQLVRQLPLLERIASELRSRPRDQRPTLIVDLIDTLSLNFSQRATVDAPWLAPFWRVEARRLRLAERRATEVADAVTLVCDRDLAELSRFAPLARSKGAVLRLPITAAPLSTSRATTKATVALTGNLGYFVNDLAARWFVSNVWPHIRQEMSEAALLVAGARPRQRLRALVKRSDGTLVSDPEDLRGVLGQAAVAVAPLSGGAGVPVKVLEAWAEGVPVVASAWAAAGVATAAVEDAVPVVSVPDNATPEEWARAVVGLLREPVRRRELATAGAERVAVLHSLQAFDDALLQLLAEHGLG